MKQRRAYQNVAAFLKETGITQEELAARCGISASYLSMILRGQRTPPLDLALSIAAQANVPVESLAPAVAS